MKNRLLTAMAVSVLVVGAGFGGWSLASRVQAAPEAPVVPLTWELSFKYQAPERIVLTVPGKTEPQTFWYFRYTVTNNTGKDLLFTPEFQLLTDTGQILTSGKNGANAAYDDIKKLYKGTLMDSPIQILGKLLQGDDNAKESVAIFTGVETDARIYKFQVSGLSGDTAAVENPLTHEKVVLRKTLVVTYEIPGQAIGIDPQPQIKSTTWVMK
ncbi:MAG: hypothetical protein WCI73_12250 [Phycisphaerae bacterium]